MQYHKSSCSFCISISRYVEDIILLEGGFLQSVHELVIAILLCACLLEYNYNILIMLSWVFKVIDYEIFHQIKILEVHPRCVPTFSLYMNAFD